MDDMGRTKGATNKKFCFRCKAGDLKRAGEAGNWYMVEYDSGARHYCNDPLPPEVPEVPEVPVIPAPEAPEAFQPVTEAFLDNEPTLSGGDNFDYFTKTIETLQEIATESVKQTRRIATLTVQESINRSIDMARSEVKALLPVEHIIKSVERPEIKIEGRPHFLLDDVVFFMQIRKPIFLVGPAGGGKTTIAEQCAEILGLPYYEKSMAISTTEWDMVGYRGPNGDYIPGVFREPFENGGVMMLDEMDSASPEVMVALNNIMGNGHASFPDGTRVKKHKDFVLVAGGNTYGQGEDRIYVGRNQLDGASLNRWGVINFDYDENAEFDWSGLDQRAWVEYIQKARKLASSLEMRVIISPRQSVDGAKALRAGGRREMVEDVILWNTMGNDDSEKLISNIGRF
jgi:cobaltochelatase CobS